MKIKLNKHYFIINVTLNDIKKGKRRCSGECPIALALNRKFPKCESLVGISLFSILNFKNKISFYPTDKMKDFVRNFDDGEKVVPTKFFVPLKNRVLYD